MSVVPPLVESYREYRQRAREHERALRLDATWASLEAAHILGQRRTALHVGVHAAMLAFAWRRGDFAELGGQLVRIVVAAVATWVWVPAGNTGRANMNALHPLPIPEDLRALLDEADSDGEESQRS